MKRYNRIVHRWIFALTPFLSGVCSPAEAAQRPWTEVQQIPAAAVACYVVGRAFLQVDTQGQFVAGQVVGYFTDINGIGASDSLFKPSSTGPSEQTAFFTFRSDVFSVTPLQNGDIGLDLTSTGTFNIYYNSKPDGDWCTPDTFSGDQPFPGQPIAGFTRPEYLALAILQSDVTNPPPFESISLHTLTETLVSSQSFTFNGHRYDFSTLVPGGVTLNELASNTGVPGVTNFPVGFAYAGNCLAVEGGDRD
jgi:hypothetical protein